jgi:glucuronoarabinoxylan endo-1,4-beta-xylanase
MQAITLLVAATFTVGCHSLTDQSRVSIQWSNVHQVIDGFGASSSNFVAPLSDDSMDFFYTTGGIGLTLLRTRIFPSLSDCELDRDPGGTCLAIGRAAILSGELQVAQMAVARGARVWSSSWSPPGSMKSNRLFMSGGSMLGNSANYESLAGIFASYVSTMRSNGVSIYGLSPQNEPDISRPYPSATWTPQQIRDFVPYLHAALQSAGVVDTKIIVAEESSWGSFNYGKEAMNDPSAAAKIGIIAAHNYDQTSPSGQPRFSNLTTQHLWQTEASSFEAYDGSIGNALVWAQRIHYFLSAARVNAFHYWYLSAERNERTDNEALTDRNGHVALRAYVMGHWSRFVRPGWHEVNVTNDGAALVTAFQSEDRLESAIVALNTKTSPLSTRIMVGPSAAGSVTPWITSSNQSLARQSALAVVDGFFSYELPAQSIVTFAAQRRYTSTRSDQPQ